MTNRNKNILVEDLVYASDYERAYGVNPARHQILLTRQQNLARFDKTPIQTSDIEVTETLERIHQKMDFVNSMRPLNEQALEALQNSFRIDFTHNSTAIENNKLTLRETALVLKEGVTISEKPLKDHLEVIDNDKAFAYVLEAAQGNIAFNSDLIKKVHSIVVYNDPKAAPAGEYAPNFRYLEGTNIAPPPPKLISDYMEKLLSSIPKQVSISDIARFHLAFEDIHPFNDANGRTGRLLLNMMLIQEGYPSIVIKADPVDRAAYYKAIDTFCDPKGNRDITPMLKVVSSCLEASLDQYLSVLSSKTNSRVFSSQTRHAL